MRQGLTLGQLAEQLQYQNDNKRDFLVNTRAIEVLKPNDQGQFSIAFSPMKGKLLDYPMSRFMLTQVASHTKVPLPFVDLMAQGSSRERNGIAKILTIRLQENETRRMIRTLGQFWDEPLARAFLSDRYRPIDNYDLANAVLPVVSEMEGLQVASCEITELRLYIKFIRPNMNHDMGPTLDSKGKTVGDVVEAGVVISNSEVGAGALNILPLIMRLVCLNGLIVNESAQRKAHVGRKHVGAEDATSSDAWEFYTDETKALDDAALFAKVKDTLRGVLNNKKLFAAMVGRFMAAKDQKIVGHPQASVQEIARRFVLDTNETQNVLRYLTTGGDLSQFGMVNAVTMLANRSKSISYDRATELEAIGGKVLALPKTDWDAIGKMKLTGEVTKGNGKQTTQKRSPQRAKASKASDTGNGTQPAAQ